MSDRPSFDWSNIGPSDSYEEARKKSAKATLADLQEAIRRDPLMNAYYAMFLRGDFVSFEEFLVNLACGIAADRRKLIDKMTRLCERLPISVPLEKKEAT